MAKRDRLRMDLYDKDPVAWRCWKIRQGRKQLAFTALSCLILLSLMTYGLWNNPVGGPYWPFAVIGLLFLCISGWNLGVMHGRLEAQAERYRAQNMHDRMEAAGHGPDEPWRIPDA